MHICFVNTNIAWGGGERWVQQFARLSRDAGHFVSVIAHPASELALCLQKEQGIVLHTARLKNISFLNPKHYLKLAHFFSTQRVDTVIMSLPRDLKIAGLAAKYAGLQRIIYRRGIDVPVKNTWLNTFFYQKVIHRLICNSQATKKSVLSNNPKLIADERICIVPNAFDIAEFDARPVKALALRPDKAITIGCAARLTPQKGLHLLLEAMALLAQQGEQFRLLLAGSGELKAKLQNMSRQLGIEEHTQFLGFVHDIKSFYASIDIFALPSLFEGFGYALVEAARCGKPAVAFNVSSNPEVLLHEKTGLLANPNDPKDFADKIQRLMRDTNLRTSMGQAAQKHALHFDTAHAYACFENAIKG